MDQLLLLGEFMMGEQLFDWFLALARPQLPKILEQWNSRIYLVTSIGFFADKKEVCSSCRISSGQKRQNDHTPSGGTVAKKNMNGV